MQTQNNLKSSIKLSAEQLEFAETLAQFFKDKITSDYLRKRIESGLTAKDTSWSSICELGLAQAFSSESNGGMGLGFKDLALLAYQSGKVLLPENLLTSIYAGPYLFTQMLSELPADFLNKKDFIKNICEAKERIAFAYSDNAKINLVQSLDRCSYLVVLSNQDLSIASFKSVKKDNCLDLAGEFYSAELDLITKLDCKNLDRFKFGLAILLANQLAALASTVVSTTVEYVKTRKQFDVPIGGFQAVQHKIADMHLQAESMYSLANFAAWTFDNSPEQLALAAVSAFNYCTENAPLVCESAIQAHGGIGFTWEYDLHLYLRRARFIESYYKDLLPRELVLDLVG